MFLEHLQGGEVAGTWEAHVRDVVFSEVAEDGLGKVFEVGLGGEAPFRGQLCEGCPNG